MSLSKDIGMYDTPVDENYPIVGAVTKLIISINFFAILYMIAPFNNGYENFYECTPSVQFLNSTENTYQLRVI